MVDPHRPRSQRQYWNSLCAPKHHSCRAPCASFLPNLCSKLPRACRSTSGAGRIYQSLVRSEARTMMVLVLASGSRSLTMSRIYFIIPCMHGHAVLSSCTLGTRLVVRAPTKLGRRRRRRRRRRFVTSPSNREGKFGPIGDVQIGFPIVVAQRCHVVPLEQLQLVHCWIVAPQPS